MATTVAGTGLAAGEARRLLGIHGLNEIRRERTKPAWLIFARQFESPLVIILIVACVLSGSLGEWAEAAAILAILILNAWIGFLQEYRAENSILALRAMTAPRATVIRDGSKTVVPATEVVPGDWLALAPGDVVAADGEILEASRLQINEAVLTGESFPVAKDPGGRAYMGTAVATGTAIVEVGATGMATELGKIAHLVATAESGPTPLQIQLAGLGKALLILCLAIVTIVLVIGLVREIPPVQLIVFSLSLAVAAVPEGMPAIVTVALALGVQRMAARNALIRTLPSVETLGSVSVICTDKTGTLTTGEMRVREIWANDHQATVTAAASCCDAELGPDGVSGAGDPTELAILIEAAERGVTLSSIDGANPRVETEPFDSATKRMSVLRRDGTLFVKGAVESVLPLCASGTVSVDGATRANLDMTSRGLRVLAVATGVGRGAKDLRFQGLLGIADPPRSEAMQAIADARRAGIRPIMITGDHPETAHAIARELGLVLEGEAAEGRVHARATPEDKLKLVRHWKGEGAIVAMTGDGVNDAPALREAHIGIAMGRAGTEVTRQSADIVLADDCFATIVAAVREGRGVYRNIRKAVVYLLTGNFAELTAVLGASVMGLPVPLLAPHLLWINLVTDSLPGLSLIADPVPADVMDRGPRDYRERLIGRDEWRRIAWVGLLEAAVVLAVFAKALRESGIERARSVAFTTFVFSQLWRAFGARSAQRTFWQVGALSNLWLLGVVVFTACLQLSLHYVPPARDLLGLLPPSAPDLAMMLAASLIPVTVVEAGKILSLRLGRS